MKLLVFSDSHGVLAYMRRAVQTEQPDLILHLGDVHPDARALRQEFPDIPLEAVCGNCDWGRAGVLETERVLAVEGLRILMLHGHSRNVKSGLERAVFAAREADADILTFGHTHKPLCEKSGPLWILNPGTVQGYPRATYGVIEIGPDGVNCRTAAV